MNTLMNKQRMHTANKKNTLKSKKRQHTAKHLYKPLNILTRFYGWSSKSKIYYFFKISQQAKLRHDDVLMTSSDDVQDKARLQPIMVMIMTSFPGRHQ